MVKKKSAAPGAKNQQAVSSPTRLPTPDWDLWRRKGDLSFSEAALISMGINPFSGVVSFLRNHREPRYKVYQERLKALSQDYGQDPLLPRRTSLPKLVTLKAALEYFNDRGWLRKQHVRAEFEKLRKVAIETPNPVPSISQKSTGSNTAADGGNLNASSLPGSHLPREQILAPEVLDRASKNLLKTVGALLLLLEHQESKKFKLSNGRLNQSAVTEALRKIATEYSIESNTVAGFSDRLIKQHLSDGRKLYRVLEGSEINEAKSRETNVQKDDEPPDSTTPPAS